MNPIRNGRFTSSEIVALTSKDRSGKGYGEPFWTYITECNMERQLGRSVDKDFDSRDTSWGSLCEVRVFDLLGTEYELHHKTTLQHPTISYWCGTPDTTRHVNGTKIPGDIKCPSTLKSFCQLIDLWNLGGINAIRNGFKDKLGRVYAKHKQGEKFYQQIVSNACLSGSRQGELIVYCPYKKELEAIRELAMNWDGPDQHRFKWVAFAADDELPWLVEGGHYQNINILTFDIPTEDKLFLHSRVEEAGKYLIQSPNLVTA